MIVAPTVDIYKALRKLSTPVNGVAVPADELLFTVVSYNILAQSHINREMYPYCARDTLRWAYRRRRLLCEVESMDADILAMQEVDHWVSFFHDQFRQRGYEGYFCEKERRGRATIDPSLASDLPAECPANGGGNGVQPKDGLVIAWKSSRFRLVRAFEVDLARTMPDLDEATPNIGQVVVLESTHQGPPSSTSTGSSSYGLVILNTHLYWRPGYDALRAVQVAALISEVLAREPACHQYPMVFCGDFNSDPRSMAYRVLTDGTPLNSKEIQERLDLIEDQAYRFSIATFLNITTTSQPPPPPVITFQSAYKSVTNQEPAWTTWASGFQDTLDYIFYCNGTTSPHGCPSNTIKPRRVLLLPNDQIVQYETALPNHAYASDHVALMAEFEIVTNTIVNT